MADRLISKQLRKMRRDWDDRARGNARHYVVTGQEHWSDEEFYRSGEVTMQEDILNDLTNICQGKAPKDMQVLEIGCGAGRVTRAFANYFGEVYAVDISREMALRARRAVADFPNAHVFQNNGKDLAVLRAPHRDGSSRNQTWWNSAWNKLSWNPPRSSPRLQLDFAFSFMVFQHIPSRDIIENYVREVNRVLRPGALFKFQVQGCPDVKTESENSWVGAAFNELQAREMAARCGFEMRYQSGAGDQYYWLWFFKTGASANRS